MVVEDVVLPLPYFSLHRISYYFNYCAICSTEIQSTAVEPI